MTVRPTRLRRGFSAAETVVTVGIVSTLAVVSVPLLETQRTKAAQAAMIADARNNAEHAALATVDHETFDVLAARNMAGSIGGDPVTVTRGNVAHAVGDGSVWCVLVTNPDRPELVAYADSSLRTVVTHVPGNSPCGVPVVPPPSPQPTDAPSPAPTVTANVSPTVTPTRPAPSPTVTSATPDVCPWIDGPDHNKGKGNDKLPCWQPPGQLK